MIDPSAVTRHAGALLAAAADPEKAGSMAAYMKTDMPFYGVATPQRRAILGELASRYPAQMRSDYEAVVRGLWRGEHREEKYLAIGYARSFPRFVTLSSIPLYRTMITQGAWWDFVDGIAIYLAGHVLMNQRTSLTPKMDAWTTSDDMWLRRTSIIAQLAHKADTDPTLLDDACTRNLPDPEFFIRKAIGWALREYAKTDPEWVVRYVGAHEDEMSSLTRREATKHLAM